MKILSNELFKGRGLGLDIQGPVLSDFGLENCSYPSLDLKTETDFSVP